MDEEVTLKDSKKTTLGVLATVSFVVIVIIGAIGYLVEPEEIAEDSIFFIEPEELPEPVLQAEPEQNNAIRTVVSLTLLTP